MSRFRRSSRSGAYARRCGARRGATSSRPSTRCRRKTGRSPRGDTGAHARSPRSMPGARRTRSTQVSPRDSISTACSLPKRSAARRRAPIPRAVRSRSTSRRSPRSARAPACGGPSSSRRSTCAWRRSGNGTLRFAASTTMRCCSRPNTRSAWASPTVRSTRPSAPPRAMIFRCAT